MRELSGLMPPSRVCASGRCIEAVARESKTHEQSIQPTHSIDRKYDASNNRGFVQIDFFMPARSSAVSPKFLAFDLHYLVCRELPEKQVLRLR